MVTKLDPIFFPSLLFVVAVHCALLYFLWNLRLIPPPEQIAKIFVNFVAMPKVEEKVQTLDLPLLPAKPKVTPKPKPKPTLKVVEKPQLIQPFEAPFLSEAEVIVPPAPLELAKIPEPKPASVPVGPITLSTELSVTCPKLTPPSYPPVSRRYGEEGKVVLRVELDEKGYVNTASVVESSSYHRLDKAALAVVKTWRCNPSLRNGQPVKAVALQPFNFVLQGR